VTELKHRFQAIIRRGQREGEPSGKTGALDDNPGAGGSRDRRPGRGRRPSRSRPDRLRSPRQPRPGIPGAAGQDPRRRGGASARPDEG